MTTRLILLPHDGDAPATCLLLEADGRVSSRCLVAPNTPAPAAAAGAATVLAVPGLEARAIWLDLPARTTAQALAAARLLVQDRLATPSEALHLAVAPAATDASWLVVVVEAARMREWLARAAALGIDPDRVVPEHLLLPRSAQGLLAARRDGYWCVRGEALAFAAEPELMRQVLGDREATRVEDAGQVEALLAAGALAAGAVDLRQGAFAAPGTPRGAMPASRRVAALLAALALSPLLLTGAQALRYELATRGVEAKAQSLAASVAPDRGDGDALAAVSDRLAQLQSVDAFAGTAGALFNAVMRTPAARLETLEFRDGQLQARLVHADPSELASVRASLAESGLALEAAASEPAADGIATDVAVAAGR